MIIRYCRLSEIDKPDWYSEIVVDGYMSDDEIAEECGKNYYDNGGHESEVKWPIDIRVFFSEEKYERFNDYSIHVDYSPNFYAYDI
jgi:hypothetical protein